MADTDFDKERAEEARQFRNRSFLSDLMESFTSFLEQVMGITFQNEQLVDRERNASPGTAQATTRAEAADIATAQAQNPTIEAGTSVERQAGLTYAAAQQEAKTPEKEQSARAAEPATPAKEINTLSIPAARADGIAGQKQLFVETSLTKNADGSDTKETATFKEAWSKLSKTEAQELLDYDLHKPGARIMVSSQMNDAQRNVMTAMHRAEKPEELKSRTDAILSSVSAFADAPAFPGNKNDTRTNREYLADAVKKNPDGSFVGVDATRVAANELQKEAVAHPGSLVATKVNTLISSVEDKLYTKEDIALRENMRTYGDQGDTHRQTSLRFALKGIEGKRPTDPEDAKLYDARRAAFASALNDPANKGIVSELKLEGKSPEKAIETVAYLALGSDKIGKPSEATQKVLADAKHGRSDSLEHAKSLGREEYANEKISDLENPAKLKLIAEKAERHLASPEAQAILNPKDVEARGKELAEKMKAGHKDEKMLAAYTPDVGGSGLHTGGKQSGKAAGQTL